MSRKAFAYIRVSTIKQEQSGSSLQEQRAAIVAYAQRFDLEIVTWFEEAETAAKRGRPQFNQLIRSVRAKPYTSVVIHKIDRSARNLKDWADLGELIDSGIDVHFAHEALDLRSRGGRLAADIQAVVAADYIRNLRDEVLKGIRGRLKQGLYPFRAPLGYLNCGRGNPKSLDPERAPLIRLAFELYAAGNHNLMQLKQELHSRGLRNLAGARLSLSGISTILNNPFYYGLIRIEKTGESYVGIHPPIISKGLFEQVQARLAGRKKNAGLVRSYLYQKLLRCYECGSTLIPELQKSKYVYYRCHVGCARLCVKEESLTEQLSAYLSDFRICCRDILALEEASRNVAERFRSEAAERRRSLQLERGKLDERMRRLIDAFLDQTIDKAAFELHKATIVEDQLAVAERERNEDALEHPELLQAEKLIALLREAARMNHDPDVLLRTTRSVTSNFLVFQKRLLPQWDASLRGMAPPVILANGDPYQGTSRTSSGLQQWIVDFIKANQKRVCKGRNELAH